MALNRKLRSAVGIGPISNLSNVYPWGFWISFDLFTGVAIGSGAFMMAATVYIFELKQSRPLIRPAVLTGFLGTACEQKPEGQESRYCHKCHAVEK